MKRILMAVCLVGGALLALPAMASADSQPPMPFVTSVSYLVDRPDSGNHGDWAKDNLTRTTRLYRVSEFMPCPDVDASTVKITAKTKASDENVCARYVGTVWDEGTFTTLDAKSPNKGVALKAGVKGHVEGGLITTEFIGHYRGDKWASDKTFEGKDGGASTTNWVKKYFDVSPDEKYKYGLLEWGWDYTTACEHWSDHSDTNGAADKDGDITGKTCPSPTPTPSPSATPTPSPSATPTPKTDKPGLPKTGVHAA